MKYRINDLIGFISSVFGADDLLKYYPELMYGIELKQFGECFYVIKNGKIVNDTSFFTEEEMQFMEIVE